MHDRTIYNALRAVVRGVGEREELTKRLLVLRDATFPARLHIEAMQRGGAKRFVLMAMQAGDQTVRQMAERLQADRPSMPRKSVHNRCNAALFRLEAKGVVVREGRLWRLT